MKKKWKNLCLPPEKEKWAYQQIIAFLVLFYDLDY